MTCMLPDVCEIIEKKDAADGEPAQFYVHYVECMLPLNCMLLVESSHLMIMRSQPATRRVGHRR